MPTAGNRVSGGCNFHPSERHGGKKLPDPVDVGYLSDCQSCCRPAWARMGQNRRDNDGDQIDLARNCNLAYVGCSQDIWCFGHPRANAFRWLRHKLDIEHDARDSDLRILPDTVTLRPSDPRDGVYGLLGLMDADITPGYSKSVEEVYFEAGLKFLRARGLTTNSSVHRAGQQESARSALVATRLVTE